MEEICRGGVNATQVDREYASCELAEPIVTTRHGEPLMRLESKRDIVHVKSAVEKGNLLDYHGLIFPGGFAYGDYVRAGAIWADVLRRRTWGFASTVRRCRSSDLRHMQRLSSSGRDRSPSSICQNMKVTLT